MRYTIENFWGRRLVGNANLTSSKVPGWSPPGIPLPTFREAPLERSGEIGTNADPFGASVILVSAPGAVGKSTLARQIASLTGAIYIDLSTADPVGANTLSGGLARSGLYQGWENGSVAVLIDGLDEARLRVTQNAFEAFLRDVAEISKGRKVPTVLFGRTGAVEHAWLALTDVEPEISVLEIGYYDESSSLEFSIANFLSLQSSGAHHDAGKEAIKLLLEGLRRETESDGDHFAGYAPVLLAIAQHVAEEPNPAALVAKIKRGDEPVTLKTIALQILERERGRYRSWNKLCR